jgi:hypothetical protein
MSRNLFSPEALSAHFAGLSPDMRLLLEQLAQRESWTYHFDEFPDLFQKTSAALPQVVENPLSADSEHILGMLIPILATMPIGPCLTGISYLDSRSQPSGLPGWGVALYQEAVRLQSLPENEELSMCAKTITERVHFILRSPIAAKLFTHITPNP